MSDPAKTAADYLSQKTKYRPTIGIVCGSGLGGLADNVADTDIFDYKDVPGFPSSTVVGHAGKLVFGKLAGAEVVCMKGRFHSYEGHAMPILALPIRTMKRMGVEILFVTNAAGGLSSDFNLADVMLMSDHICMPGLGGKHPLVGHNDDNYGVRFPAMSNAYDKSLRDLAWHCVQKRGMTDFVHKGGVYAMVSGPSYETPSECRLLNLCGADCVGMSTAPECIVARHCGIRVMGISLITNLCVMVPGGGPPPNHEEVLEATHQRGSQLETLVQDIIRALPNEKEIVGEGSPDKPVSGIWGEYHARIVSGKGASGGNHGGGDGLSMMQLAGAGVAIASCFMLAKALRD